jgi:hypothetical protein
MSRGNDERGGGVGVDSDRRYQSHRPRPETTLLLLLLFINCFIGVHYELEAVWGPIQALECHFGQNAIFAHCQTY